VLKLVLSGLWACAITLLASYVTTSWRTGHGEAVAHEEGFAGLEFKKTKPLNVPMIADGVVQGYIVAQFNFTAQSAALKRLPIPPDIFLLDEAFRSLYADDKLDFRHLERYDITKLTTALVQKTNERLNMNLVKDVLVQEFNYVSKDDMKR
jgi:hypothetical protein